MNGERFGPYRLEALLGRGGMGEVWRAVDTRKDREVALKVIGGWLNGDQDFAARFRREAALAARLRSPHIVAIHDYGDVDGRLFIDMALVSGTDLARLTADGPLAPRRAVHVIAQTADALDTAHHADLLHRDVKPSNILIMDRARDFTYLIDFGIARAAEGTKLSLSGSVIGTPAYMAPERFDTGGDRRGDVYALACVLYEALTGQPPFVPPEGVHTLGYYLKAHLQQPPPRPSAVVAGLPAELDAVVARGMAKEPDDRYGTAGELAAAAAAALGTPAAARPTMSTAPTAPGAARGPTPPTTTAWPAGVADPVQHAAATAVADRPDPTTAQPSRTRRPWWRRWPALVGVVLVVAAVATVLVVLNRSAVLARFPVQGIPGEFAVSPDGSRVYALDDEGDVLLVFDTARPTAEPVRARVAVEHPTGLGLSPDGTRAYLTSCTESGRLAVLDTADPMATPRYLPAGRYPCHIAVAPNGARAYVGGIDRERPTLTEVGLGDFEGEMQERELGHPPDGLFLSPDGQRVYVVHPSADVVAIIDLTRGTRTTFRVDDPRAVAFSPDGSRAFITSRAGQVLVADARDPRPAESTAIAVADADAIVLTADGTRAVVSNSGPGTLTVIDTTTMAVVGSPVQVGTSVADLAVTPDGRYAYVAESGEVNNVVVVELPAGS